MKKRVVFFVLSLMTTHLFSQAVTLDTAIQQAGRNVEASLSQGANVAVLNISSLSEPLSDYIIEELTDVLVNGKRVNTIDRKNIDLIRNELHFQNSGDVSDESAQAIGEILGAQTIISGSLTDIGGSYRLRIQAINVATAVIEANTSHTVLLDERISFLIGQRQSSRPGQPTVKTGGDYRVGDYGPAGGIVFYDKGRVSGGWRYLEAAPADTETSCVWGSGVDVSSSSPAVGTGQRNTQYLLNALNAKRIKDAAAQYCDELEYDNFTDWFLPSSGELELMYKNLKEKGLGDFSESLYWSSTSVGSAGGGAYDFSKDSPGQKNSYGALSARVRAIRAFQN